MRILSLCPWRRLFPLQFLKLQLIELNDITFKLLPDPLHFPLLDELADDLHSLILVQWLPFLFYIVPQIESDQVRIHSNKGTFPL